MDALQFQEDTELQVGLYEGERPFQSLVQTGDGWDISDIGTVTRHRVEQGAASDLFSYTFVPNQADNDHTFQIGTVKSGGFVDHRPLYEPLLEMGWIVKSHNIMRAGLEAITVFDYPEVQFPDPINWDQRLFNMSLSDSYLTPSLIIKANTRVGSRYSITGGIMRLVCTNGLIAKALGLGDMKYTIWENNYDAISKSVREIAEDVRTMAPFEERAHRMFPTRSTRWLAQALRTIDDPEPKPIMITESLESLTRHLHDGERANLALNFALMATQHPQPEVSVLDTLNAITSASPQRALSSLDQALDAANALLELGEYITR